MRRARAIGAFFAIALSACASDERGAPPTTTDQAGSPSTLTSTTSSSTSTTTATTSTASSTTTTTVAVTTVPTTAAPTTVALASTTTAPPSPPPPPTTLAATPPPSLGSCPMFPADSYWHADVSRLPVHSNSAALITSIGATATLKADFGSGLWNGGPIGIPYLTVSGTQAKVPVSFQYADESDKGPYPIPANAPIEGGASSDGDRHVLVVDSTACVLYELFAAYPAEAGAWRAGSGAIYDLRSNALRPAGWTSADAAGLPILPGLVRYDEVAAGSINHAIRITVPRTRRSYVWPARHFASSRDDTNLPPMGLWLRLRSDFDVSGFAPQAQVILNALKKHGAIVADNGSPWFMSGAPDERWNNDVLQTLRRVPGSAFEAVDTSGLMVSPNSGQRRG